MHASSWLWVVMAGLSSLSLSARAQSEPVDPEDPPPREARPTLRPDAGTPPRPVGEPPTRTGTGVSWDRPTGANDDATDEGDAEPASGPPKPSPPNAVQRGDAGRPLAPRSSAAKPDAGVEAERDKPQRPPPPAVIVTARSDADLEAAWASWRSANSGGDVSAEQRARSGLLRARRESGADDLGSWAMGLLRAASAHEANGDSGGAIEIALTAVEVAPHLPAAWFGLARAYSQADPSELSRVAKAVKEGLVRQAEDPRYSRPIMAHLAAVGLFALVGTAILVVGVLFVRRSYYFFHDFHFLFPRSAARWQTTSLAVIVLLLPIVFRMGVAPALLALFAAVCLYLTIVERAVAVVLIGLLGGAPLVAGALVERTAYAGTHAELLAAVDTGAPGSAQGAQSLAALAAEGRASFEDLFVLGRWQLRRGQLDAAIANLKVALRERPNHPEASTNLGAAFFLSGDLENSRGLFEAASKAVPPVPAAYFNLGRVHQRRAQVRAGAAASEVDAAAEAFSAARALVPGLQAPELSPTEPIQANELALTVPLPVDQLLAHATASGARVQSQLSLMLLGDVPEGVAPIYPGLVALALLGLGFLGGAVDAARACNKCGRPVSRRVDPDVSPGSLMCTQCVNVFAKKNVVAPSLKVRKQLEVAKYQLRLERVSYVLGVLVSGLGHVFAGWPVRGALYAFAFVTVVAAFVLRHGFVRAPYQAAPEVLRLVPMAIVFVGVVALSLRGLRKRQGG